MPCEFETKLHKHTTNKVYERNENFAHRGADDVYVKATLLSQSIHLCLSHSSSHSCRVLLIKKKTIEE